MMKGASLTQSLQGLLHSVRKAQYRRRRDLINFFARRIARPLAIEIAARREQRLLAAARADHEASYARFDSPLVTVTIATYNRAALLMERAVPSALRQSYPNLEVVIVGDGCTDDTGERIARLNDPRVRFVNLPERGSYPETQRYRWMVAGTVPINHALDLAQGRWIAHLDDDDIFEPDHVEVMLREAYARNLEFVYGRRRIERTPSGWDITGAPGSISHSAVVFRSYLRLFRFDINAWRLRLAVDHHIWLRMERAGVRMGFVDHLSFHAPLRPGNTRNHYHAEDYP